MTKVIGLMSGTSVDGIDAALVEITGTDTDLRVQLLNGETIAYPIALREQILAVCGGASLSMEAFAQLDDAIATQFALAAQQIQSGQISAQLIGSHGQTIFHRPPDQTPTSSLQDFHSKLGYSLQLGRGAVIAELTGIPTVSNFRVADIAAGGQGAPLVSKVDAYLLSHLQCDRCLQNIGGIGNVTYLPAREQSNWEQEICGWDTGPGNALLDLAISQLTNGHQTFDENGNWASQGIPCQPIVEQWLQQDFFQKLPPKSTGRELFGQTYLEQCWQDAQAYNLSPADWLATLTELTVMSIVHSYRTFLPRIPKEILLCGGGSRNSYLKERLQIQFNRDVQILTTDEAGVNGELKEAIAFAVLAYWRYDCSFPGNLPKVTGAKQPMLLGEIALPW
jgi:anhydro-N-acetylmuramic acid kinase